MKTLLSLLVFSFAATAFGQYYVPPFTPWRQTLFTNTTMAGVRSDLGITATNWVVNTDQFDVTGDILGFKEGALVTNVSTFGFTNQVNGVGFSNQLTGWYWPADPANGQYIDFHRGDKSTAQWIRFYDDNSTESNNVYGGKPFLVIGPDIANTNMTYFVLGYDTVAGSDTLNIGNDTINRAHVGVNAISTNQTFVIADPPAGIWLTSVTNATDVDACSMLIRGTRQGLRITSSAATYSDLIRLERTSTDHGRFIDFHYGDGKYDYRMGSPAGDYGLKFYQKPTAGHDPSVPGTLILALTAGDTPSVYIPPGVPFIQGQEMAHVGVYTEFTETTGWTGDGWIGQVFGVSTNDMLVTQVGRMATSSGFTNTHKVMIINQADFSTNLCVTLPRAREGAKWYYVPCNTILTNGGRYALLTDSVTGDDPYHASALPLVWDSNITNRFPCTHAGEPTNAVSQLAAGYTNYWLGLVNYVRQ